MLMNDLKVLIYKLFLEIFYGKIIKQLIFFDNFLYFLLCQNFLNIFINHYYKDTYYIMHNFIGLTNSNATNRVHLWMIAGCLGLRWLVFIYIWLCWFVCWWAMLDTWYSSSSVCSKAMSDYWYSSSSVCSKTMSYSLITSSSSSSSSCPSSPSFPYSISPFSLSSPASPSSPSPASPACSSYPPPPDILAIN